MKEMTGEIEAMGEASTPRFAMNWPSVRPKTAGNPKMATKALGISPILISYASKGILGSPSVPAA